jgi:hypothetical protein
MKTYTLLEKTDLLKKGDLLIDSSVDIETDCPGLEIGEVSEYHFGTPLSSVASDAVGLRPVKKTETRSKWKTGDIPDPCELSVLILETKYGVDTAHINNDRWRLGGGPSHLGSAITSYVKDKLGYYTGRWFIQKIKLPK